MRVLRALLLLCATATAACGTLSSPASGDNNLPANRTGPYGVPRSSTTADLPPCVATDAAGLLDEPSAVRLADGRVALYVTRVQGERRTIARALSPDGVTAGPPQDVLAATRDWQRGAVASPGVTAVPGGWLMAYATAGGIGLARSGDGVAWTVRDAPDLVADASAGEATALAAPSVAVDAHGAVALAYGSAGAIWLARAPSPDGPFTRVDALPETPARDPILAPGPRAADGGVGFDQGAVGDPALSLETTPAGRALWRLFYTARAGMGADGGMPLVTIGLAGAFDGVGFVRLPAPVFTPASGTDVAAPAMLPLDEATTLLYVGARCDASQAGRGVRLAVAPATRRLP